jgi:RecJ-like exonuclease
MDSYTDSTAYACGVAFKELGEALMCENSSMRLISEKALKAGLDFSFRIAPCETAEQDGERCPDCAGTGYGDEDETCQTCCGTGLVNN